MKNSLKALVVVAILAVAGMANAQNTASATATANATVVCPISITDNTNLEFGTITNSASGGYLIVGNGSSTTYSGIAAYTHTAAPHEADFTVGGEGNFAYTIVPSIVGTGFGSVNATLSNLTWELPNSPGGNTAIFPCDGDHDGGGGDAYEGVNGDEGSCGCVTDDLKIGGRIDVTSAASGAYVATINVQVTYN